MYYSLLQTYCFVLQSTTPYYKVLLQYYSLLQSTTLYYKVLLRPKRRQNDVHPVLLRTTKYYSSTASYYKVLLHVLLLTTKYFSVLQSTTSTETTSERRPSSTTPYYKVLLQYYKVLLQHYSVLQSTTPVLQSTTPYYKVLLQYYSVLQSTTPVLLRTTNVLQSTTPYYRVLLQYYSVLQSSTKASKTSISCEASSTFQGTSFQNEHFVRDFLNFSKNKLPKRVFRARLPQLFKRQASKTSISCEASATFQGTSFQNEHFVRGFLNFSRNKLPKRAFRARLPQLFNQGASKVLRLPRKTRK